MNTRSIPWIRLLAEGAAITLSILAAFAVDAWWDARRDRTEEMEILIGLRAEFEEVAERLDGWAEFNQVKAGLVERALTGDPSDAGVDSLLSSMPYVNVIDRGGGSLEALLSSGRLELIRDRDLRVGLARWPDRLEDIHTNDLSIRQQVWGEILPHMATFGVPDGACGDVDPFCVHEGGLPISYRRLLNDPEFRSLLAFLERVLPIVASDHAQAAETARGLVLEIDRSLGT